MGNKKGIERLDGFHFFEFKHPYYALIKSINPEFAVKLYEEQVAAGENQNDVRQNMKEVDKFYALGKFYNSYYCEHPGLEQHNETMEEYFEYILKEESGVMLLDGSFL
ncbi:hypothetical protein ACFFJY_09260 [Fictibacillus aquaticus]|uniref:Uncharacterized protein n=1 Tax=Fictibacillus aquaticus TaxID=2021314 RepID=A0A235FBR3_9BACL|nr:hypothetical protein [Fictibacillus aquaticus]OYD58464.1 hypothetical protein CGZ90_00755 [Fictibacillus aquaticus]